MRGGWRSYVELSRPFTLLAPAAGMVSAGIAGLGAEPAGGHRPGPAVLRLALGAMLAVFLNAASNALNQVCDLEIDRINKPARPLPSGRVGVQSAGLFAGVLFLTALALAALLGWEVLLVVSAGALAAAAYSMPPVRTKRFPLLSNFTIALARGLLLPAAGWAVTNRLGRPEPWYLGGITFLFILGAASTKDFRDVAGDRAGGVATLPIIFGPRRAARIIAPALVVPFLLFPLGTRLGVLTGRRWVLEAAGAALALWGLYTAWLILRRPDDLGRIENHPSWMHMYLMMLGTQGAVAAAYWPW